MNCGVIDFGRPMAAGYYTWVLLELWCKGRDATSDSSCKYKLINEFSQV